MFESIYIIIMCVILICVMLWMLITHEKIRKVFNQPTIKELNNLYKEAMKEKKLTEEYHQPKKVWEDIPLIMDKDEFFTVY